MGLIPAHAGKTHIDWGERVTDKAHPRSRGKAPGRACPRGGFKAHPRSRGENNKGGDGTGTGPGSSPLTRGKLCFCGARRATAGLIPAHAGKTGCHCG